MSFQCRGNNCQNNTITIIQVIRKQIIGRKVTTVMGKYNSQSMPSNMPKWEPKLPSIFTRVVLRSNVWEPSQFTMFTRCRYLLPSLRSILSCVCGLAYVTNSENFTRFASYKSGKKNQSGRFVVLGLVVCENICIPQGEIIATNLLVDSKDNRMS